MKLTRHEPSAPLLLESMRAVGYEPDSAVADLIDNSITAGARNIDIRFPPGRPQWLTIADDGRGMAAAELSEAMRHGSRDPNQARDSTDLGRFGLGLKTASLSQCRRLTVLSKQGGNVTGMAWDLDEVAKHSDWMLCELDAEDVLAVPQASALESLTAGTVVVWEHLDRLGAGDPGDGSVLGQRIGQVRSHLALVFHRFLSAPANRRISIRINNRVVEAADPFLEDAGSVAEPEECIDAGGAQVRLRAFTLPHISRLSKEQIEKAGGERGLRREQGFYVYRGGRLIVWGTWFRLFRQEELTKLTRVRVDVPNSVDQLWSLDIKKSSASPPAAIRDRLRALVPRMMDGAKRVQRHRGRETGTGEVRVIWRRMEGREGIRYEIDPDHPLISAFRQACAADGLHHELDAVLRSISATLPVEALYNDRAQDRIGFKGHGGDEAVSAELETLARQMLAAWDDDPEQRARLLMDLRLMEPFSLHPDLLANLEARLR